MVPAENFGSNNSSYLSKLLFLFIILIVFIERAFGKCLMPEGDYTKSCDMNGLQLDSYESTDPDVPPACKMVAECDTDLAFVGRPPITNTVFFPEDVVLDAVTNNNGTLTQAGKPLSTNTPVTNPPSASQCPETSPSETTSGCPSQPNAEKSTPTHTCLEPEGSYKDSCKVETKPHTSSDPNLGKTEMCKAEAQFKDLKGEDSETLTVYFNHKSSAKPSVIPRSLHKIENCDGKLVSDTNDKRCQKDVKTTQEIAKKEGQTKLRYRPTGT